MAVRPLVKQTIARTQLEVAEKLDDLLNQNNIEADSILDIEITRFGANQFLILAVYYGIYVFWTQLGLVVSRARQLVMQRIHGPLAGLRLLHDRTFDAKRALADAIGLGIAAITWVSTLSNIQSAIEGLTPALGYVWLNHNPVYDNLVGLGIAEDRDVACSRSLFDDIGLAVDVSYTHYHP